MKLKIKSYKNKSQLNQSFILKERVDMTAVYYLKVVYEMKKERIILYYLIQKKHMYLS